MKIKAFRHSSNSLCALAISYASAGRLCLCLGRLSMEREGQGKISVQPLYRRHRLQPQQPPGEVDSVPGRITRPAAEPASPEGHGRVLVRMEGAHRPALAVKGQPIMTGHILGAHPFPALPENISQAPPPPRLPTPSAVSPAPGAASSGQTAGPPLGHRSNNSRVRCR